MKGFFDPLRKANLVRRGAVNVRQFSKMPFAKLLDTVDQIVCMSANNILASDASTFSHCASVPMAGGPGGCSEISCRAGRVDQLARFAALYSDRVYFHNFLASVAPSYGHPPDEDSQEFRSGLSHDLALLLYLKPLIEAGLLVPYSTPRTYCPMCFAALSLGKTAGHRVAKAQRHLFNLLFDDISIDLDYDYGEYGLTCHSKLQLFEHEALMRASEEPPYALKRRPRLLKRVLAGETIAASKSLRRELRMHEELSNGILYNGVYQMIVAESSDAAPLASSQIEINAIESISCDAELRHRNLILQENLSAAVPFVIDVPLTRLVRLRKREEEAFVRFRASLREALGEVASEGSAISKHQARALYNDVLAPEVSRIEQAVREAKRDLVQTPIVSGVGVAAAIAIGTYTGLLPAEAMAIGKALGFSKITYDTVKKTSQLTDTTKSVRQDKFYYLWKVRQAAKGSKSYH